MEKPIEIPTCVVLDMLCGLMQLVFVEQSEPTPDMVAADFKPTYYSEAYRDLTFALYQEAAGRTNPDADIPAEDQWAVLESLLPRLKALTNADMYRATPLIEEPVEEYSLLPVMRALDNEREMDSLTSPNVE